MKLQFQRIARYLLLAAIGSFAVPLTISAQDHGSGHGGGGGCGDVFGDLIHILREPGTGQPILAQRWVEMPEGEPGFGWGYCPIAVKTVCDPETGVCEQHELRFEPFSCDVAEEDAGDVEAVDYFGRLNGGRTKERNNRMHFDEVISTIKDAGFVGVESTGRLQFGFNCMTPGIRNSCGYFETVDSPMESMALYVRMMKYGHFQTDPDELDTWAHGDPATLPQYHPALDAADWPKFHKSVKNLLPGEGDSAYEDCWVESAEGPVFTCADPEELSNKDFVSGSTNLAAAASKHGFATEDLLQYVNRILKIAKDTNTTKSTMHTLPALYRDCWASDVPPFNPPETDDAPWSDPTYDEVCLIKEAAADTPGSEHFPDMQERFVDYSRFDEYERDGFDDVDVVSKVQYQDAWTLATDQPLLEWVELVNGYEFETGNIEGAVDAINDVIRSIEYVHNYDPPEDLYCVYQLEGWCFVE